MAETLTPAGVEAGDLTMREQIWLGVAEHLAKSSRDPKSVVFSAEDAAVWAWKRYPKRLGLRGYSEHPDFHRMFSAICGMRGLANKGHFVKCGVGRYTLGERPKPNTRVKVNVGKPAGEPGSETYERDVSLRTLHRLLITVHRERLGDLPVGLYTKGHARKIFGAEFGEDMAESHRTLVKRLNQAELLPGFGEKVRLCRNVIGNIANKYVLATGALR